MVEEESGRREGWKAQAASAAIRQGPSFVVLVVLLAALGKFANYVVTVGVPAHLEQIKAGYVAVQASHDRNLERVVATFKEEQDRYRAVVELMERLVENRSLLQIGRAHV